MPALQSNLSTVTLEEYESLPEKFLPIIRQMITSVSCIITKMPESGNTGLQTRAAKQ